MLSALLCSAGPILLQNYFSRNVVVGIVSWNYYADSETGRNYKVAWAVNTRVLSRDPFQIPIREASLPLCPAPSPSLDARSAYAITTANPSIMLNGAPPPLPEWVGRSELLQALTDNLLDSDCKIAGLLGFGGEGKSSIARRWLDIIPEPAKPDGIFWWNFSERPDVNAFFETALAHLCGKKITSSSEDEQRQWKEDPASVIAAMLGARHYLFVLDGLEAVQYEEEDLYGQLKDQQLHQFLSYFASPEHTSFCLITSRAPLLDLIDYTTYAQHNVGRLSLTEGRMLLRNIGILGSDTALDQVVTRWDGNALALSLVGSYLVEQHGGDPAHADDFSPLKEKGSPYDRIYRILQYYDEHLTPPEHAFLMLFSAFRLPPNQETFDKLFRKQTNVLNSSLSTLNDADFTALINHLIAYRILHYESETNRYSVHVLIRDYYRNSLAMLPKEQIRTIHESIASYYSSTISGTQWLAGLNAAATAAGILLFCPLVSLLITGISGATASVAILKVLEIRRETRYHLDQAKQAAEGLADARGSHTES